MISYYLPWILVSTNAKIDAINKFVLYNAEETQQWVALYEEKIRKWDSDRKAFRQLNGRILPYHDHLKENMPKICPNDWVIDQIIKKYGKLRHYTLREEDTLNTGIGCNINYVIISLSTTFNLLCIFDLQQLLCFY